MAVDLTITLGNVLTLVALVVGACGFWAGVLKRFDRIELKVNLLWAMVVKQRLGLSEHDPDLR